MDGPSTESSACPVCDVPMTLFDSALVLGNREAVFHRCGSCGLIAALEPTWLDEAYASAIYDGDSGLLKRSRRLSRVTEALVRSEGIRNGAFLDWGGGYGALTRMMRDRGFDFFTTDAYARNLLAPGFDGDETATYALVTAFEVVEHLADPVSELAAVAANNDRLFFTTQVQPAVPPRPDAWHYYALDSGQHISFHTVRSLRIVGERLGYELTSNGDNFHLFHRVPIRSATRLLLEPRLVRAARFGARTARSAMARSRRG